MGDLNAIDLISDLVIYLVVLLLAISVHEAGHAWTSWKFGDDTAYMLGRVTLNPVKHTDPIGTLLIPTLGFVFGVIGGSLANIPLIGWGKPTPVNPRKWTNYKVANIAVSLAGIIANLILATIGLVTLKILIAAGVFSSHSDLEGFPKIVFNLFFRLLTLNVSLAIFNLLPFPPLDGSKVLSTFLPASVQPVIDLLEQYGFLILLLLLYWGILDLIMQPVFYFVIYLLKL